jgi:hypothetical protein
LFESISPQKILFEKVTNVATSKEKPHELKSNILCESQRKMCDPPPFPPKNLLLLLFGFSYEAVHLHCQQTKALFPWAHTKDVIWRNSEVCTNFKYT